MIPMIILAAGQGSRLRPLTNDRPKCMVELAGKPLLHWQTTAALNAGIKDIVIVGGYRKDQLKAPAGIIIDNPEYNTTNMVASLWKAKNYFKDGFIISYADIVYDTHIVEQLKKSDADITVVVDRKWRPYWQMRTEDILSDAESLRLDENGNIKNIGQKETNADFIEGQYIGLLAFKNAGVKTLCDMIEAEIKACSSGKTNICEKRDFNALYMTDILQGLINAGQTVKPIWIDGGWLEIDSISDLDTAKQLTELHNQQLVINR